MINWRDIYKNKRLLTFREFEFLKEKGNSKNFFPKLDAKLSLLTTRREKEENIQTELDWF